MKGSLSDLFLSLVIILTLIIGTLMAWKLHDEWKDKWIAADPIFEHYMDNTTDQMNIIVGSLPFIYIIMLLIIGYLAFMTPNNPIFFPIALIVVAFHWVFSVIAREIGIEFITGLNVSGIAITAVTLLINHLPTITLVFDFVVIMLMFIRGRDFASKW